MGLVLLLMWLIAATSAYLVHRDIFSPVKFYLLYLLIFFADLFSGRYSLEVEIAYLVMLLIAVPVAFQEKTRLWRQSQVRPALTTNRKIGRSFTVLIWILSIIPFIALYKFITHFGGFQGFVNSIGIRVVAWKGMGYWAVMLGWNAAFNQLYLAYGLVANVKSRAWWLGYGLHMLLVLPLLIVTGSRSSVLFVIVFVMLLYHYLRTPISTYFIAASAVVLLVAATALDVARTGFKYDDGRFLFPFTTEKVVEKLRNPSTFRYGVVGLDATFQREPEELQKGMTYVAAFTNLIPRKLWPDKPSTGGIVFTNTYYADAWLGYSNATPGLLGEAVLNFGWTFGPAFAVFGWLALLLAVAAYYKRTLRRLHTGSPIYRAHEIVLYLNVAVFVMGLTVGEFANTVVSLVMVKLAPILMSMIIVRYVWQVSSSSSRAEASDRRTRKNHVEVGSKGEVYSAL